MNSSSTLTLRHSRVRSRVERVMKRGLNSEVHNVLGGVMSDG